MSGPRQSVANLDLNLDFKERIKNAVLQQLSWRWDWGQGQGMIYRGPSILPAGESSRDAAAQVQLRWRAENTGPE